MYTLRFQKWIKNSPLDWCKSFYYAPHPLILVSFNRLLILASGDWKLVNEKNRAINKFSSSAPDKPYYFINLKFLFILDGKFLGLIVDFVRKSYLLLTSTL